MSHHVYTSKGVILRQFAVKEADRVLVVLTRELGLVLASARGVRKTDSRLGSALLDLAEVKISLVRGKRSWRVTTATLLEDTLRHLRGPREAKLALARVVSLLLKLVHGEEKNAALYDELTEAVRFLSKLEEREVPDWELYTVARLLSHLGYLSKESTPENIEEARSERRRILSLVNAGIQSSGLS